MMNLYSGEPFWPLRNGFLAVYPPLREHVETEVAIIGAGVTGALVAWHLAEVGIRSVILDRRDAALGSTAACTALLQFEIDVPLRRLAKTIGEKDAVRAYRCSLHALKGLGKVSRTLGPDDRFRQLGSLQGAPLRAQVRGLEIEHELRLKHGFRSEFWNTKRVRAESALPYHAMLRSADAAQMDPHRFTTLLLEDCVRKGVRIFDRTEVVRRKLGKTVMLTTASGCRVKAKHLVLATGYETEPELPDYAAQLYSTFALVTEPLPRSDLKKVWPGNHVIWETSHPYHYLRRTDDDRILIGGGDIQFRGGATRDALLARKRVTLMRRLRHLLPGLEVQDGFAWCGTFAETKDGLPCIGRCPKKPANVYYTLGYGGNGVTFSLIAAKLIRDQIMGEPSEHADLFRMDRPSLR